MKKLELLLVLILILTLFYKSNQQGYSGIDDFSRDTDSIIYGDSNGTNTDGQKSDETNDFYFLGFGKYMKENYKITFRIYFIPTNMNEQYLGEEIKFHLIINYMNRLRALEEEKEEVLAVCTQNEETEMEMEIGKVIFDCEAHATKNKDIKSIISKRDYSYAKSNEIHLIESSNSINANIAEETEDFLKNDLFILNDGILLKDGKTFTIEGLIRKENKENDIVFSEKNVNLILNDVEGRKKIPCDVENFDDEYYGIKCTLNESIIDAQLNSSFCFGKNQNLLINMRKHYLIMSQVINGTIIDKVSSSSSKGLSVGAIIGIILPCVIIIISGLTIGFIYLTKPKPKTHIIKGSSAAFESGIEINNE